MVSVFSKTTKKLSNGSRKQPSRDSTKLNPSLKSYLDSSAIDFRAVFDKIFAHFSEFMLLKNFLSGDVSSQ